MPPTPDSPGTYHSTRDMIAVVPQGGVRRALLVATGRYIHKGIKSLTGVDPDVDLIRECLLDSHCGFKDENVVVLKTEDYPTLERLEETLAEFLQSCGRNDFIFLYFSGHGFRDPETNVDYYVPFDAKPIISSGQTSSILGSTCFSLGRLREKIGSCPAKFKWVIIDACRVNTNTRTGFDSESWNTIGKLEAAEGSLWFQSCGIDQKSYEIPVTDNGKIVNHGLFTWYFCKGAKGEAANRDGLVSPMGLFKYARDEMLKAHNNDNNVPKQVPLYSCQELSDAEFLFVDVSDRPKIQAERAYTEAYDLFLNGEYEQALEKISIALKLYAGNPIFNKLEKNINKSIIQAHIIQGWKYFTEQNYSEALNIAHKVLKLEPQNESALELQKQTSNSSNFESFLQKKAGACATLEYKGVKFTFRYCPSGSYIHGPLNEIERMIYGSHREERIINEGFWISETQTTQKQWDVVGYKKEKECEFKGAQLPVETVSWYETKAFIQKLNELGIAPNGWRFDLPTEIQWEYACLAGFTGTFMWDSMDDCAWYWDNSGRHPHEVGTKQPNDWGIFDMMGNVWEWTNSRHTYIGKGIVTRGGCWGNGRLDCRPAS